MLHPHLPALQTGLGTSQDRQTMGQLLTLPNGRPRRHAHPTPLFLLRRESQNPTLLWDSDLSRAAALRGRPLPSGP